MTHYSRRPGHARVPYTEAGESCVQIAEFSRDEHIKLKLQVRTFNGARYLDLRLHERNSDGTSSPTIRGLTLRPSELDRVITALERARHLLQPPPNEAKEPDLSSGPEPKDPKGAAR